MTAPPPNQPPTAAFTHTEDVPRRCSVNGIDLDRRRRHHRVVRVELRVTARRGHRRDAEPHLRRGRHLHGDPHGDRQRGRHQGTTPQVRSRVAANQPPTAAFTHTRANLAMSVERVGLDRPGRHHRLVRVELG